MLGGGRRHPTTTPTCAQCTARTDAQSWASGLAAAKRTACRRKKGLPQAPQPLTRAAAPTAARPGDAAGRRDAT
ncbi:hypothetical protein NDU88_000296 [Pleurodeles waltl]|uniref:Uncharacterized protein n=1 Tax=Pleurodeles waltl TaxID=8319 RepID=A0AAV7UR92_PLEWA|nr:hypothetical protein NDU88_000296 [Pleurodeles waltl]